MQETYGLNDVDKRKLKFLYDHSDIDTRCSVIKDYGVTSTERNFFPKDTNTAFPLLEQRMEIFDREAVLLSVKAINECLDNIITPQQITHLITVSCTGMSAP